MNTVSKQTIAFAEKEMQVELKRFIKEPVNQSEIVALAKKVVEKIDWNNSALMHKGLSWIAKNYIQQNSLVL